MVSGDLWLSRLIMSFFFSFCSFILQYIKHIGVAFCALTCDKYDLARLWETRFSPAPLPHHSPASLCDLLSLAFWPGQHINRREALMVLISNMLTFLIHAHWMFLIERSNLRGMYVHLSRVRINNTCSCNLTEEQNMIGLMEHRLRANLFLAAWNTLMSNWQKKKKKKIFIASLVQMQQA